MPTNQEVKKHFNYSLFFSLLILNFIPSINEVVKVLFANTNAVSMTVISQIEWFDLINEVLMAALVTPMYSILNRYIKDEKLFNKKVFQCGVLTVALYSFFLIIVYIYVSGMVELMFNSSREEMVMAEQYLKLETLAFLVGIIFSYANVVFVTLGKSKYIYSFIITKTVILIATNSLLIPNYGSFGIAYSNILTNGMLSVVSVLILVKNRFIKFTFDGFKDYRLFIEWFKVGVFQGGSIFIANVAYSSIVVKMINDVQGLGDYWIANNFIWGWLLIPAFALSEVIKSECKDGYLELNVKSHYKVMITTLIVWVISIPLWSILFKHLMGIKNPSLVFWIVLKSLPFYVAYLFSSYIQSIFQGLGKTEYCLLSSLVVNSIYYGILFMLTKNGVLKPSLNFAILMFGFGMVFSLIIDIWMKKKIFEPKYIEASNMMN